METAIRGAGLSKRVGTAAILAGIGIAAAITRATAFPAPQAEVPTSRGYPMDMLAPDITRGSR